MPDRRRQTQAVADYSPERESAAVAAKRAARDRELTPVQRLERLHRLCAELAAIARKSA